MREKRILAATVAILLIPALDFFPIPLPSLSRRYPRARRANSPR